MFEILKPHYLKRAQAELAANTSVYLAVLIQNDGSMPRHSGAWLMSFADGSFVGTVGGGRIEHLVLKQIDTMRSENTSLELVLYTPQLTKMACGGEAKIAFIQLKEVQLKLLFDLAQRLDERKDSLLEIDFSEKEACFSLSELKSGLTKPSYSAEHELYTEPIFARRRIYIFGAGHIAQALAPQLRSLDFDYVLVDDRAEFVMLDCFAGASIRRTCAYDQVSDLLQEADLRPCESDFAVVLTKGHLGDIDVLSVLSHYNFAYIGCVGSAAKRDRVAEILTNKGVPAAFFDQVKLPIGLPILAESPAEIAISILSELVFTRASLRR